MESKEFDIEEFKKNSMRRRRELRKYLLMKEQQRKKRIKMAKGIIAGGVAVVIMGVGVVKYLPGMFVKSEAKIGNNDYSNSQINENNRTQASLEAVETTNNNENAFSNNNVTGPKVGIVTEPTEHITEESKSEMKDTEPEIKAAESEEKSAETTSEIKMTVGGNCDNEVAEFLKTETGQYVNYYSECYGVDPYIIGAICMQESSLEHERNCPGGDMYSGYGVGICQLESPDGSEEVTAHNYQTGEDDSIIVTMDNACDVEKNIQISCMLFQNSLDNFNGNCLLSIQSHNYGKYMLDVILNSSYKDPEKLKNDYSNISWLDYVSYAHSNPGAYINNWDLGTYGDGEYVNHVLSHCPSKEVNYIYDNQKISFRLDTLETVKVEDLNVHTKTN